MNWPWLRRRDPLRHHAQQLARALDEAGYRRSEVTVPLPGGEPSVWRVTVERVRSGDIVLPSEVETAER